MTDRLNTIINLGKQNLSSVLRGRFAELIVHECEYRKRWHTSQGRLSEELEPVNKAFRTLKAEFPSVTDSEWTEHAFDLSDVLLDADILTSIMALNLTFHVINKELHND